MRPGCAVPWAGIRVPDPIPFGQCPLGRHGSVYLDLGSRLRIKRLFETLPIAFDLVMKDGDKS